MNLFSREFLSQEIHPDLVGKDSFKICCNELKIIKLFIGKLLHSKQFPCMMNDPTPDAFMMHLHK